MNHLETGKSGEEIAALLLEQKGYRILERNWRSGHGEIDLIAMYREKTIVFVEVKARGTAKHGRPVEAVGKQKEDILARTAAAYCRKINWEKAVRFDTISVILRENSLPFLEHFEDAFWPGWK